MAATTTSESSGPPRAGLAFATLLLVAVVANMNLAVCNVALPNIAKALQAGQIGINMAASGYSLGLAASVLYFGAIGDRYGRKQMLLGGMALSIPAACLAAWAPNIEVLVVARIIGGLSAGMAYPTTLALITALWVGPARVKRIALWSAVGGAGMVLSALVAGWLVMEFWWGSVFIITPPLAILALVGVWWFVPNHVEESTGSVDHIGGVLSILFVGPLVLGINFVTTSTLRTTAFELWAIALIAGALFIVRQRSAANPLYDLHVAKRRTFWTSATAGMIVFGSLMGSMYVGQQYLQNVHGYSPLEGGAAIIPLAVCMVFVARFSAKLIAMRGSRFTLLVGMFFLLTAFVLMYSLWRENTPYWQIALAYGCIGLGVGFAGTPASQNLTNSVPLRRVGMASGTADLQRDLGGAVMQSTLGAILASGYAAAITAQVGQAEAASGQQISDQVVAILQKSYGAAADFASGYPQYQQQIIAAARDAFVQGQQWAFGAAIIASLIGAAIVVLFFPNQAKEQALIAEYHQADAEAEAAPAPNS